MPAAQYQQERQQIGRRGVLARPRVYGRGRRGDALLLLFPRDAIEPWAAPARQRNETRPRS